MAATLRNVWFRRNCVVFENRLECPNRLMLSVKTIVKDQAVQTLGNSDRQEQVRGADTLSWEKPDCRYVKINWDASLDQKRKKMGVGIIIRDETGKVLATMCDQKGYVEKAVIAECQALRTTVELCSDLQLQKVEFEGDAKEVILSVSSEEELLTSYGYLVDDVRFHFKKNAHWSIHFTHREKNMVAQTLAKKALFIEGKKVWLEDFPKFIVGCLNRDFNFFT
ncbi:uncharacterized protein LOC121249357 [Juglans microcarpa x Juglans regia]|uniref:uncharacterized protein LOC121249357 n=1 Tax=Juglans microcarpa x Juglans regia TaxID=2249226 RepID=UPI001B7F16BA|nr:uncharacterized protein LOC121249357 [Juglans microcarpa x Juglans regia]